MLKTEYEFVLPLGYQDANSRVHREGVMRLVTAKDEIETAADSRVQKNPAMMSLLLLARTVTQLGAIKEINLEVLENLFQADFVFLQELYNRINTDQPTTLTFSCPHCQTEQPLQLEDCFSAYTPEGEARRTGNAVLSEA